MCPWFANQSRLRMLHTQSQCTSYFSLFHLLACLPDELGNLKKLETLNLSHNSLATLPDSFVNLKCLRTVVLSRNRFTTVPLCICQLTHADFVDLSANKIVIIPDGIQVISAVEINLNQNQINRVPEAVASCKRLKVLRLEENCLYESGIPPVVLAASTISLLCLQGNPLDFSELRSMPEYDKVCLLVNGLHVLGSRPLNVYPFTLCQFLCQSFQYMERFTASRRKAD